ncbi:hypothetical protein J4479_05215 [Candidatus Woesearchaeota archaeon]|nr:hypothetical protein [Candidatus Woesearchaeota archaeon]
MVKKINYRQMRMIVALMLISILLNLPLASALQISNVRAEDITSSQAVVKWDTDAAADSFVNYGESAASLRQIGDARPLQSHAFTLTNLNPEQEYLFSVESSGQKDDNSGEFYKFATLEIDSTPPKLEVKFPELVAGKALELNGTSEAGAKIAVKDNNQPKGSVVAAAGGRFSLSITLEEVEEHTIIVTATDRSGNEQIREGTVKADFKRPIITLAKLPEISVERSLMIKGNISEESKYEIWVNNKSAARGEGLQIEKSVSLESGQNKLKITAVDKAGFDAVEELAIQADFEKQFIQAEIENGLQYFENRAQSNIRGKTKPGSKVYLYVFRPLGYEYKPDFSKARAAATADAQGEFKFEEVNFAQEITDFKLENLAPKQVPKGLLDIAVFSRQSVSQQQQFTYQVYLIAEDVQGRTEFSQHTISVVSCSSGDLAFAVSSMVEFQMPLRLVPQLLDGGRQEIQAVFDLQYQGSGVPGDKRSGISAAGAPGYLPGNYGVGGTGAVYGSYGYSSAQQAIDTEQGFRVDTVRIEKACAESQVKDEKFAVGCRILPNNPQAQRNNDGTKQYVTWKLARTKDFSKTKDDFWNDLKHRRLTFPLKITVNYQERQGDGAWVSKTQASCYDLGYAVDIPLDSKKLIPDFLANEGVNALNFTISQLQTIRPIIEKVYLVTAMAAVGTFALRTAAILYRVVISKTEAYFSFTKGLLAAATPADKEKFEKEFTGCPLKQSDLYLKETIENWCVLIRDEPGYANKIPVAVWNVCSSGSVDYEKAKAIILEERCPQTAAAWKVEEALNTAYRWTWDRSFCRAVPAAWTAKETEENIGTAILNQQQCAVTGRGVTLYPIENCQQQLKAQVVNTQIVAGTTPPSTAPAQLNIVATTVGETGGVCWKTYDNTLYYLNPGIQDKAEKNSGIFRLTPAYNLFTGPTREQDVLLAYQPPGAQSMMVGRDVFCNDLCKSKSKTEQFAMDGCYDETTAEGTTTLELNKQKMTKDRYAAGYTRDCFIKGYNIGAVGEQRTAGIQKKPNGEPIFQQCVCKGIEKDKSKLLDSEDRQLRTAVRATETAREIYSYHEDRKFIESKGTIGTYYPKERYYPQVNPHTETISTFQSVCLSGILKNLKILENILVGLRNCIVAAKYTGLQDAGACKTLFTEHVCGLVYKAIAYLNNQCSPITIEDKEKEGSIFGDAGEVIKEGFKAIPQALSLSVEDVQRDYGNAKLNEYFRGGVQGLSQSMCLWAFGAEFPLFSTEFLLDAAYSFPTKSSVFMTSRERELSTFNPAKQTAVFNYNLGGVIMPGCNIRNWKISLKCIGPEEIGQQGVDTSCGGRGCDCLNAQGLARGVGQKEHVLMSNFNLKSGDVFSIPLESPIRLDLPYRYDHVKVELYLDPLEKKNAENCFESGYFDGVKGVFYEPLVDTSPPDEFNCQANLLTGEYRCSALSSLLGFGGASFEEPLVSCWNKNTNSWTSCDSPNLFIAKTRDQIKLGAHVNLDDNAKCLKRTISPPLPGLSADSPARPLPANNPGQSIIPDVLTNVDPAMFTGTSGSLQLDYVASNRGCRSGNRDPGSLTAAGSGRYRITLFDKGSGQFEAHLSNVYPADTINYAFPNNVLEQNGKKTFTLQEIKSIRFNMGGEIVYNFIDNYDLNDLSKNFCEWQVTSQAAADTRQFRVNYQLLEADETGGCTFAREPARTVQGRTSVSKSITIQKEEQAFQAASGIADQFQRKNYPQVFLMVNQVINQRNGDINNALALYYGAAAMVLAGQDIGNAQAQAREIQGFLSLFFERQSAISAQAPYDPATENDPAFQKIAAYMCKTDESYGKKYSAHKYCKNK